MRQSRICARFHRALRDYAFNRLFDVFFVYLVKGGAEFGIVAGIPCAYEFLHPLAAVPCIAVGSRNVALDNPVSQRLSQSRVVFFRPDCIISGNVDAEFILRPYSYYRNDEQKNYREDKQNADRITCVFIDFVHVFEQRKRARQDYRAYAADDKREKSSRLFLIGFRCVFILVFVYGYFLFFFFLFVFHDKNKQRPP